MNTSNKILIAAYSRAFRWLSIVVLAVMWSCASNEEGTGKTKPIDPDDPNANVLFEINVPKSQAPSTYALDKKEEDQIKTVEILLFKTEGDDKGYTGKPYYCDVIEDEVGEPSNKKRFMVALPKGGPYDVVILANSRKIVNDLLVAASPPVTVTEKADVLNLLTMSHSGKWISNTSDIANFVPFPMWGELLGKTVSENLKLETILTRMLAKIDVALTGDAITSLKLQEVHLINPNDKGHLVPAVANFVGERPTAPTLVSGSNTSATLVYESTEASTPEKEFIGVIYTFEAKKAEAGYLSDATCLVLKGTYKDGSDYYYRVDFGSRDIVADTIKYLDILRNMKYSVNINKVNGPGKGSLQDAIDNPSANIDAGIVIWNSNELPIVVWDNQNSLGFSKDDITVGYKESHDNQIKVRTDYSSGWKVDKIVDIIGGSATWLTLLPTSGAKDLTTDLQFDFQENFGTEPRVCYIYISAGTVSHIVKVTQTHALRIFNVLWEDYNSTYFPTITIEDDLSSVQTSVVSSTGQLLDGVGGAPRNLILDGVLTKVTVTYKDYVLNVPADKFSYSGTTLTISDRTLIGEAVHLDKIRLDLKNNYIQVSDVSLLGYTNTNGDLNNWVPIGFNTPATAQFTGSYDGGSGNSDKGFTISNLKIDRATNYNGLFGYASATSVLDKIHIAAGSSIKGGFYTGSICGDSRGSISNSSNEATVTTTATGNSYIGGIVGQGATITSCTNNAVIKGNGNIIGGICGYQLGTPETSKIINCHNLAGGIITAGPTSLNVGGIAGSSQATISACSNDSDIVGLQNIGGICGRSFGGVIADCDNTAAVEATETSNSFVGGIAGQGVTITGCTNNAAITGAGGYVGGIAGYSNIATSKTTNCKNLLGGNVKGTGDYVGGIVGKHEGATDVGVCTNAGNVTGTDFVGGLFGSSAATIGVGNTSTGTVTGVSTVGNICGDNSGKISGITNETSITATGSEVGGIAGKNLGTVEDCTNTASVSGTGTGVPTLSHNVGGIVGYGQTANSKIINCHNAAGATISGTGNSVGGICGYHEGTDNVGVCTNAGNITGKEYVGGLFGSSAATIIGAGNTSTGTVTGNEDVGNICGENTGKISGITNNTPITSIGERIGGIAGVNAANGTITLCHNIATVDGTAAASNFVGGVVGNNIGTVSFCTNKNKVTSAGEYIGGIVGHSNGVAGVFSCDNLLGGDVKGAAKYVGGVVGVLDAGGQVDKCTNSALVSAGTASAGGVVGVNIASVTNCENKSTGNVTNGGIHTGGIVGENRAAVSGSTNYATVNGTSFNVGGIVGNNANAGSTITDCHNIAGAAVSGAATQIGGIVGVSLGKVDKCFNYATVTGTNETGGTAGGICGKNSGGKIQECENKGAISLTGKTAAIVGGIVGDSDGTNASVFKCHNRSGGTVTGKYNNIGGVVGRIATGTVDQCTNNAAVSGTGTIATTGYITNVVGGIAGSVDVSGNSLTNCTNGLNGNVTTPTTSENTGGVVGVNRGTVSGSKNFATIVGGQNVGGIAGHTLGAGSSVSNCINEAGTVRAEVSVVGGIVGANAGEIKACINKVAVSGPVSVGGINGHTSSAGSITACINQGAISATTDKVGGILGSNSTATVVACYNIASVTGTGAGAIYGYKAGVGAATNCYYGGSSPATAEALPFSGANWPKPRPTMTGWELTTESPAGPWASRGTYSPLVYPTLKP